MDCITIHMRRDGLGLWSTLLQKGVGVQAEVGISIASFLENQLGMEPAYVENVVRTIFVNGSPVDDVDVVPVQDGDVLALAGAMPGLVGIAMGRQSLVGGFRDDISCRGGGVKEKGELGRVTVKAFNVVARDAVEILMGRGIVVSAASMAAYLADRMTFLTEVVVFAEAGGKRIALREVSSWLQEREGMVAVRIAVD